MRKNELLPDPPPSPELAPFVEQLPEPLGDGAILRYVVEDAGMNYPDRGLWLAPGYDYEVGEDMDGQFAARLVQAGFCEVSTPPAPVPPAPEQKPVPEQKSMPAPAVAQAPIPATATAPPAQE